MNLFKISGFLTSSEPAIGRSQELAADGWCRRTAELPLLVELERAACPQKSRKTHILGRAYSGFDGLPRLAANRLLLSSGRQNEMAADEELLK